MLTTIIRRTKTNCGTLRKCHFWNFEGFGPQMRFQILSLMILAGVGSGVWPKSAWSPSYEKNQIGNC